MKKSNIQIIIADDRESARAMLRDHFKNCPGMEIIAEAVNGEELVRQVNTLLPDVVITDLWMPVMHGLQAIGEIRLSHPSMPCIIQSSDYDRWIMLKAVKLGVLGMLTKTADKKEMVMAARSVYEKRPFFDFTYLRYFGSPEAKPQGIFPYSLHNADTGQMAEGLHEWLEPFLATGPKPSQNDIIAFLERWSQPVNSAVNLEGLPDTRHTDSLILYCMALGYLKHQKEEKPTTVPFPSMPWERDSIFKKIRQWLRR